jgi:hypothetical protein
MMLPGPSLIGFCRRALRMAIAIQMRSRLVPSDIADRLWLICLSVNLILQKNRTEAGLGTYTIFRKREKAICMANEEDLLLPEEQTRLLELARELRQLAELRVRAALDLHAAARLLERLGGAEIAEGDFRPGH